MVCHPASARSPKTPDCGSATSGLRIGTLLVGLFVVLVHGSCKIGPDVGDWVEVGESLRNPEDPAPLQAVLRIVDTKMAQGISLEPMLDELADSEVVFFGETHLDESTHRLELAVYEGLVARRGNVVLAMEMFERDVQPKLDAYLQGRISEEEFLEGSRPWSNYPTGYRALVESAKRHGLPVLASNPPSKSRKTVAFEGEKAFLALSPEEKKHFAPELHPHLQSYWDRFVRAVRGHMGGLFQGRSPEDLLYSSQSLWDNTMADTCVRALERFPGCLVFHVNGDFHSVYGEGIPYQLRLRRPDVQISTISVSPVGDLARLSWDADVDEKPRADFVVFAESRAQGYSSGYHSVEVPSSFRFRLHVPDRATDRNPVPLVVVLGENGTRAFDHLAAWKAGFGEDVALVVLEAPTLERGTNLRLGGKWFDAETFFGDLGRIRAGIERTCRYVRRNYPVSSPVVLVGEGAGGTAVATTALTSHSLRGVAIAIEPTGATKIGELSLPRRSSEGEGLELRVHVSGDRKAWWEGQLSEFAAVGVEASASELSQDEDPGSRAVSEVRRVLNLAESGKPLRSERTILALENDSQLGRRWARTLAACLESSGEGRVSVIRDLPQFFDDLPADSGGGRVRFLSFFASRTDSSLEPQREGWTFERGFSPDDLLTGRVLPVPPGSFGGTTILWVPEACPESDRASWQSLEEKQPIRKRSPFSSLVVLFEDGDVDLRSKLIELRDSGRKSVLVVPAVFCASDELMRRLEEQCRGLERHLQLSWSPGLGERLHLATKLQD